MRSLRTILLASLLTAWAGAAFAQSAMSLDVATPTTIAGWGIADTSFPTGDGVDAVHVWAYAQGQDEGWIFLGATSAPYFSRPDVAYLYGTQHGHAGWALSLPVGATGPIHPGRYTVCAYVHSWLTNAFVDSRCVSVVMFYDDGANDPNYPFRTDAIQGRIDALGQAGTVVYPMGWAAVDSNVFDPATVTGEFLIDDWGFGVTQYFWNNTAYRPDVCAAVFVGHCSAARSSATGVVPSDNNYTGVLTYGIDVSNQPHGWHFVRLAIWSATPGTILGLHQAPWRWFYVQ